MTDTQVVPFSLEEDAEFSCVLMGVETAGPPGEHIAQTGGKVDQVLGGGWGPGAGTICTQEHKRQGAA